jgi:acyl carrier protein
MSERKESPQAVRDTHVLKRSEIEREILNIWSAVIGNEGIGSNDNFFEVGGSSLHALEIVELIDKKFSVTFTVVDLFENPTIALLAASIESRSVSPDQMTDEQRKDRRRNKILERREKMKQLRNS